MVDDTKGQRIAPECVRSVHYKAQEHTIQQHKTVPYEFGYSQDYWCALCNEQIRYRTPFGTKKEIIGLHKNAILIMNRPRILQISGASEASFFSISYH